MDTPRSEKDLARYLQTHKGDPEEWEETPEPAQRAPSGDSVVLSVRLKAEEVDRLKELADSLGVRVSELVREALQLFAGVSSKPQIQLCVPKVSRLFLSAADAEATLVGGPCGVTHARNSSGTPGVLVHEN